MDFSPVTQHKAPPVSEKLGYIAFILHAHLPFIYHPEYREPLEEDWLHEAVRETYLPLLHVFRNLISSGVNFRITVSFSGSLISMLTNDLLKERIYNKLKKSLKLAEMELERTKKESPEFFPAAQMYYNLFSDNLKLFEELNGDILKGYKMLAESGYIELMSANATHAFSPLIAIDRAGEIAIKNQIEIAVRTFQDYFGWTPKGMWLPECAYARNIDKFLLENGIKYTILEYHGILYGEPYPVYGTFMPYETPEGLVVFGRDFESSKQVWSAKEGYPGDFDYREFYRDIGYDLPMDYIREFIHESGLRKDTGIKYYRITGVNVPLSDKQPYIPKNARAKASTHAGNFIFNREKQIEYWYHTINRDQPLVITAPYDAELFGHWWFEGPLFLEDVFRKLHEANSKVVGSITPSEYLERWGDSLEELSPNPSSWGWKGYYEVWLNGSNDYIYRHLHIAANEMVKIATEYADKADKLTESALNQAVRELLQAQCSDWPFIMFTGTVVQYARDRFRKHITNFWKLINAVKEGTVTEELVKEIHDSNPAFNVDFRSYALR